MDNSASDGKYVTQAAFDSFVKSVSQKINSLDAVTRQTVARAETLLKVLCDKSRIISIDDFVDGLSKYDPFVRTLKEIRSISKMSERIEKALKYNRDNPDAFQIMADDINILEQAQDTDSISRANYDNALRLPHTRVFSVQLQALLDKSE